MTGKRAKNDKALSEGRHAIGDPEDVAHGKTAEERLSRSESLLRQAQRIARLGHWRWSHKENCLKDWSDEFAAIIGVAPDEMDPSREAETERTHPADRDRLEKLYRSIEKKPDIFEIQYRIVRPNGEIRHIREVGEPEFDSDGNFLGLFGTIQDITDQKQAEQALLEREAMLEQAQRQAQLGYWRWSITDGKLSYLSAEAERIIAKWMDHNASTNAQLYENIHRDDRDRTLLEMETADNETRDFDLEYRAILPDGEVRYIREIGEAEFDRHGHFIGHFGTIQDITNLRATEESLRESKGRLADFAEAASDWLWEMDASFRFTDFSAGTDKKGSLDFNNWRGLTRENLANADPNDPPWQDHLKKLEKHEPFRDFRYTCSDETGNTRYLKVSGKPFFDPRGEFLGYRGTGSDETEEVLSRKSMETLQQRFLDALDSTSEGIALWDAEDRLVLFNENYRQRVEKAVPGLLRKGITFEEFIRKGGTYGLYGLLGDEQENFIQQRLIDHRSPPSSRVHEMSDGQWVQVNEYPTREGGVILVRRVITEQVMHERELTTAKEHAELANRAKTEFLANMSHELRTPLNAILGFSEMIARESFGPTDSRYTDYARDIHSSGLHLLDLIGDILDLSRIEAGHVELMDENIDSARLLESCLRLVEDRAKNAKVELTREISPPAPQFRGDERKMKQVLINLLSNAVKFTDPGGKVTVAVAHDKAGNFIMSVTDTGIGMKKDEVERALEPFVRLESSLTRRYEGTGLGLSLVKALTELHQGWIQIVSEPKQGTKITVTIPRSRVLSQGLASGGD